MRYYNKSRENVKRTFDLLKNVGTGDSQQIGHSRQQPDEFQKEVEPVLSSPDNEQEEKHE